MDSGPAPGGASRNNGGEILALLSQSIRPRHLEHGVGIDDEIIASSPGADDRACQRGLVDAVLDEALVDVNRDHLAERQPGLRLPAVGALQLDDLGHLALERYRT